MSRLFPAADQRPGSTRTLLVERGDAGAVCSTVRRTVLAGGLRVISEAMPGVRSVAFGAWVGVGSRDETSAQAGVTHFLEHLLFKGTRRRSALEISSALESVGGELNAFTAREYTCYHARVLDQDLPLAVDVVADMLTSAVLLASDVENERGVILEEIAMHDDDIDDVVHETFNRRMWDGSSLGRPVIGTVDSIGSLTRRQISGYYRRRYRPERMVMAAAGNVDHAALVRLVRRALSACDFLADADADAAPAPARLGGRAPRARSGVAVRHRPTEHAAFVLGVPGIARADRRRYALGVLNATLGAGPSSRLFQEVREKRGLAYSVYSYADGYADTGVLGVSGGCHPAKIHDVLGICRQQLADIAARGITEAELALGKGQMRGMTVLGLEDTDSRMSRIAKSELVYGELPSLSELLARIDAVTLEDVRALAADLLSAPPALAVVGPFDEDLEPFTAAVG